MDVIVKWQLCNKIYIFIKKKNTQILKCYNAQVLHRI